MRHRRDHSMLARLLIAVVALALVATACSDDDDGNDGNDEGAVGGSVVDLGTFAGGGPEHLDPALNSNVETYSVVTALYDGLTEVVVDDDGEAEVVPLVAESFESNDDGTEWTFTIREDLTFSDGEELVPSSFVRGWERASDPELAGAYAGLFALIEGGGAKLDGEADTISGVTADDEARTLTVQLVEPYADFPAVAGFQVFYPMPSAVEELDDQSTWEQGVMIGNGPFVLAKAPDDREIVLERNEEWAGDFQGTETASLDEITFRISADIQSAYNAFEAGEADVAALPRTEAEAAAEEYGTTSDVELLSSYHFQIRWDDPMLGGPENVELRKAISLAIDREEINEAVYGGTQSVATGVTPPGIPGFERGLCDYCEYDPAAAAAALVAWEADGNELTGPVTLQVNAGSDHEPALQIAVDNLAAIGIDAEFEAIPQDGFIDFLAEGGCKVCRWNWVADYATYDNFLIPNFHTDSIGGPNWGGYSSEDFDELVDEAMGTLDADDRASLFRQAEEVLLNDDVGTIAMFWSRGTYVYDDDRLENFVQTPFGVVLWERVTVQGD